MKRHAIVEGTQVALKGRQYIISGKGPGGYWALQDLKNKQKEYISKIELLTHYAAGELFFVGDEENTLEATEVKIKSTFTTRSEDDRNLAKRKLTYIKEVMKTKNRSSTHLLECISTVSKTIDDENPPSKRTLQRWLKDYSLAEQNIRMLLPHQGKKGNRDSRLNPLVNKFIDDGIKNHYLTLKQPSMMSTYRHIGVLITRHNEDNPENKLAIPTYKTCVNRIKKIDDYTVTEAREGPTAARRKYKAYGRGPQVELLNERGECDGYLFNLFVLDDDLLIPLGRPHLVGIKECASKSIAGFHLGFEPESAFSYLQAYKHAIMPKTGINKLFSTVKNEYPNYGIFETLVFDNSYAAYSKAIEEACLDIGTSEILYAPRKEAWFKGSIESFFSQINQDLLSAMPGKAFVELFKDTDYDPAKDAVIRFSTLIELLHVWVVDVLNQSPHWRTGKRPADVWKELEDEAPPYLPENFHELNIILGKLDYRTVTRKGLEWEGLFYNCDELQRLRSRVDDRELKLKYDPSTISHLYALDEARDEYIMVPAINQEYTAGLSLYQHQIITKNAKLIAKEKVDMEALWKARVRIQDLIESELENRSIRARSLIARYKGVEQTVQQALLAQDFQTSEPATSGVNQKTEDKTEEETPEDLKLLYQESFEADYSLGDQDE